MRGSNPIFSSDSYQRSSYGNTNTMSIRGTINKTLLLLLLLVATSAYTYNITATKGLSYGFLIGVAIVCFILVMVTMFKPAVAPFTAPIYALLEGVAVGNASAIFEGFYSGIVLQAVCVTLGVTFAALLLYTSRTIRVTSKFRKIVMIATLGVFITYLVQLVFMLFGVSIPFLHQSTPLNIGISIVILIIASLNLLLDFDQIESGTRNQLPKVYEWVSSVGLLVTLVWIYFEALRLVALLRNRD